MKNRQNDKKKTKQIRIDTELHHQLKILAANERISIKILVERVLAELVDYTPIS